MPIRITLPPRALRRALLSTPLALVAACASAPRAAAPSPLRVLVYNIHAGMDAAGVDNLERVAGVVRESGADIVLLQEVDRLTTRSGRVDQVDALRRLTGMHGAFGRTLDFQGGGYGIAVLSRWPIVRDTLVHLAIDPPQERAGGSHEPRGALHAVIARGADTVHVLNTHLDASRDDRYRRQESAGVAALARAIAARGGTLLVGGDLNSEPGAVALSTLAAAGMRDAWAECGAGPGLSFPAAAPVKRIDYLLLTGSARCTGARVLESEASDHRGVLFEVEPAR
jgi:endonuclease/exonuclease/phosphatase family metal-dependent hydrolase